MKGPLAIITFSITFICLLVPMRDLFEKFTPLSVCLHNDMRLIILRGVAEGIVFIAYMILSFNLYMIWRIFKDHKEYYKSFYWKFSIFLFTCGISHLMGAINLFAAYYWIETWILIQCAFFSILTAIDYAPMVSYWKGIVTKEEFDRIHNENEDLKKRILNLEEKGGNNAA